MKSNKVIMTAIIGLVVLECVALFNGINGTLFTIIVGAVAGLAGYTIPNGGEK